MPWKIMVISGTVMLSNGTVWSQQTETEDCNGCVVMDDLLLDTVTVDGLRPVTLEDVSSSVSIMDAEELAIRDAPFLADTLRAVPGVAVSRSGARGGLTQIRMRGAEANHTLVLVDGIEVSDPTTGETDFGLWSGLDIARIEVLRGEQSTLYGSDAIGGVISITAARDEGWRGAVEAGSDETVRGRAGLGGLLGEGYFSLGLAGFATGGVDTAGLGGERDGSEDYSVIATGAHGIGMFELRGLARYSNSTVETDPDLDFDGRLDNADRETGSEQWLIGGVLEGHGLGLSHVMRASYSDVMRENSADGAFTDSTNGTRTKLSWSPSRMWGTGDASHTLSGLIDYEREEYARTGPAGFFGDPNQSRSFRTYGFAGEYRFALHGFAFNASARQDLNDSRFEDATTWRIGGAYNFDFNGRVRASAGTGVKNPTFVELFGFFPGSFVGNPDLVPETSQSWEIGWDQDFGPVEASVTYFSAELEDEIFTAFTPTFQATAQNRTGVSARSGVELGARWHASPSLRIHAAATFTDSSNDTGADEIRVPQRTASLGFDWQSARREGVRLGAAFDYVGAQDDFDFGSIPAMRVRLDSYVLFSLTGEYPLTDRISLTVRGENLFDEAARDVFGFNAPGAAGFIGLRLRN